MINDENGGAGSLEFGECDCERFGCLWVQIGARLVQHECFGAERKNAGKSHLLLLAFGERVYVLIKQE